MMYIAHLDHFYTEFGIKVTMPKKKLYRSFDNGIGKYFNSNRVNIKITNSGVVKITNNGENTTTR